MDIPSGEAAPVRESRIARWLWLLPVVLGAIWGATVLGNSFLADDDVLIVTNPLTHDLGQVGTLLTSDYYANGAGRWVGYYRPLTRLAFAVEYACFGASSMAFHAVSLIAFLITVVLVGRLALALGLSRMAATVLTCFFAGHPAQAASIAVVASQSDVFMGAAVVASLLAYLRARRSGKTRWLVVAACAQLAAVAFKEAGLVAALLAATWELLHARPSDRRRRLAVVLLTFGPPVTAVLGLRFALRITTPVALDLGPIGLLGLWGKLTVAAIVRTLVPVAWTPYLETAWPGPDLGGAWPWAAGASALVLLTLGALWWRRDLRYALAWLWLPLLPILALPARVAMSEDPRVFLLADRWLLLSVVGAGYVWVTCGAWLWARLGPMARITLAVSVSCVLALHALLAHGEGASLATDESSTLWLGAALESKASRTPVEEEWYLSARAVLADRGPDRAASVAIYRSLLALRPHDFAARYNLAASLYEQGSTDEALEHAWTTFFAVSRDGKQTYPRNDSFHRYRASRAYLLGLIFERKGDREAALRFFRQTRVLDPQHTGAAARIAKLER